MPFGFSKYLENKNRSQTTVESYTKTVESFFSYLRGKYKKDIELYKISSKDILDFFGNKVESGHLRESTANKQIAILKNFFDYLWKTNLIPIDPAVKIQKLCDPHAVPDFLCYQKIQEVLSSVLVNPKYSNLRKAIFLLGTYGCVHSEFTFEKDDVRELENGSIVIELPRRTLILEREHSSVFKEFYRESFKHDSPYVFTSKDKDGTRKKIELMTLLSHLRKISSDYDLPIRLTFISMKWSLGYYLLMEKEYSIPEYSKVLGNEDATSASAYAKFKKLREKHGENIFKNGVYKA